ncbi:MAG TPA: class I SAM-dependent methyltransferase [Kofleriaceae bacterium]|nr:class I SAM-dependent methyltransferase [Kofleriaceae bacterium]
MKPDLKDRTTSRAAHLSSPEYILGHTQAELDRLIFQARFYERQTRLHLVEAGLAPGMRVLDFGCGVGDVAFLAATLVGDAGHVVGFDRSEEAVQTARARAAAMGLRHVEFRCADDLELTDQSFTEPFDAVVGRLVLMYQPDPAECLRRLSTVLRPGGVAMFHEAQMAMGWYGAYPPSPTLTRLWGWMSTACARAGIEIQMGLKMRQALLAAGFVAPELLLTSWVSGGPEASTYEYLAHTIRSLLPAIVKFGIATAEEVDIETLAARLRAEVVAMDGAIVPSMLVGGVGRWPGHSEAR